MEEIIHFSEDKLPPLRLEQFRKKTPPAEQTKQQQKGVYTVFESLQDEYVVKNLDLELGTLGEFIDLNSAESTSMYQNQKRQHKMKKEKKDQMENEAEMFMKRANVEQVQRTPFEVLKYEEDEKKRGQAAKDIVHIIFKKIYGEDIEKFEEKNSKQILQQKYLEGEDVDNAKIKFVKKYSKKNAHERFDLFEKQMKEHVQLPALKLKLEHQNSKSILKKQDEQKDKSSDGRNTPGDKAPPEQKNDNVVAKQKSAFFGAGYQKHIREEGSFAQDLAKLKEKRLEMLLKLKASHQDVNLLWGKYWGNHKPGLDLQELLEIQKGIHPDIAEMFAQFEKYSMKFKAAVLHEKQQHTHNKKDQLIYVNLADCLMVRNIELKSEVPIWLCMHYSHFADLTHFELYNCNLKEDAFKVVLTLLDRECPKLHTLNLSGNKLTPSVQKLLLDYLHKQNTIRKLILHGMGMNSKQFVEICLSICQSQIKVIDFSNNKIDKRGQKPLETLMKYVKTLEQVDISENQLIEENEEEKTRFLREMRKILIYNKGLKNNIKI